MSCLDSIVTLGACPDEATSLSGFTLLQAAGISPTILADIANEHYMSGANMAMEKKRLTLAQIKNDFVGAMQRNRVTVNLNTAVYDTSRFNMESASSYAGERGVTVHKNTAYRGSLRQTKIKAIQLYPLQSGDAVIKVYDNGFVTSFPIELVGNQVNTFSAAQFPDNFPFSITGSTARVLIDQTTIPFASATIECKTGCNGSMPNACGWADGWNGAGAVKSESYGINVQFYCECDYSQILCDLSSSFAGELIWLKWQLNIMEEATKTNRFSEWVIYGHDELVSTYIPDLTQRYTAKWNDLMDGMDGILKTYRDDCLNCRGIKWVTNV